MTGEHSGLPSTSRNTPKRTVTRAELTVELERLAVVYPRVEMSLGKWKQLQEIFFEDLHSLTLEEIRDGCRRYRGNAENRFFPSPGQLAAACRDPYAGIVGRRPRKPPQEDGPVETPEQIVSRIAALKRVTAELGGDRMTIREPSVVVMTQEMIARERALKPERAESLRRRMETIAPLRS